MLTEDILWAVYLILNQEILELIELIDLLIIDVRLIFYYLLFFYFLDNNIPGPNAYKNHSLIGCNIFDSRYKSPSFITLSKKFNFKDRNAGNPGPGSYIRFSEFGILAPKRDKEKEKEKDKNENQNQNENNEENNNIEENEKNNNKETDEGNKKYDINENENENNNGNSPGNEDKINEVLETA